MRYSTTPDQRWFGLYGHASPPDDEYNVLPHVVLTSDIDWDPAVVDNELDFDEWLNARMDEDDLPGPNSYGDY